MASATQIIIVSDIFGHNDYLKQLIADCRFSATVTIVAPYDGRCLKFDGQADAYECFNCNGGLDALTFKVKTLISTLSQP
ncbi:hypothetical protein ACMAZF_05545 [Psychrobium sp. nBUS_13]|uniref:hypothetical protein n=1 Tax=Psychrobium sp. nBUS_13 TaxID=3395319 RepID=UPI003EC07000